MNTSTALNPSNPALPLRVAALLAMIAGHVGASAHAQTQSCITDAAPRSVFLACPDDAPSFFYCHPEQCKKQKGPVDFPNWSHVTNTANPPRTIWLVVCLDSDFFFPIYTLVKLAPGETWWGRSHPPTGFWSWINVWVIDPLGPFLGGYELGVSNSSMRSDRAIEAETFGTVQARFLEGVEPITSSSQMFPNQGTPWQVDRTYTPTANGMVISENWSGNGDISVDRFVTTKVEYNDLGFTQTVEVDIGKDGSIDMRSLLSFTEPSSGSAIFDLSTYDGNNNLLSNLHAEDKLTASTSALAIRYDLNGDGVTDRKFDDFTIQDGNHYITTREIDADADGVPEKIEFTQVNHLGPRNSTQSTQIRALDGVLLEDIQLTLTPQAQGYSLDTLHDMNGNGTFDIHETHISVVGPFAAGLDDNLLGIDMGNDGTYENVSRSVTLKQTQGANYSEINGLDISLDGIVDGITLRNDVLSSNP